MQKRKGWQGVSNAAGQQVTEPHDTIVSMSARISELEHEAKQGQAQLKSKDAQIADLPDSMRNCASVTQMPMSGITQQQQLQQQLDAMQATHAKEVAVFKAQAAQAKAEYMQVLHEKQVLQDAIYDLKVGQAALQS